MANNSTIGNLIGRKAIEAARKQNKPLWIVGNKESRSALKKEGFIATRIHLETPEPLETIVDEHLFDGIPEVIIALPNNEDGREASEALMDLIPTAKVVVWPKYYPEDFDLARLQRAVSKKSRDFTKILMSLVKDDPWLDESQMLTSFLRDVKVGMPYMKTGYETLDKCIDGLIPGALHAIQGNPSSGKTTFMKQLADQMVEQNPGIPVFFFALEDSLQTVRAMTCSRISLKLFEESKAMMPIENRDIRKGGEHFYKKRKNDLMKISNTAKKLYLKNQHLIAGEPDTDIKKIKDMVLRKMMRTGDETAIVLIDYLQILPTPTDERLGSLMDRVDYNLHELQCFARDINGPVVVSCSTTKEAIKDTEKNSEPGSVKGKGSANILFSCRMLFELIGGEDDKREGIRDVKLHILKNSEGAKDFSINFKYDYKHSTFKDFEEDM